MTEGSGPVDYSKVESSPWEPAVRSLTEKPGVRLGAAIYGLFLSASLIVTGWILASSFGPWFLIVAVAGVFGLGLFSWRAITFRRHATGDEHH